MSTKHKPTKASCEKFAQEKGITLDVRRWKSSGCWFGSISVDLPEGMITTTGYCGLGGEFEDTPMAEVWEVVWGHIEELSSVEWVACEEPDVPEVTAEEAAYWEEVRQAREATREAMFARMWEESQLREAQKKQNRRKR